MTALVQTQDGALWVGTFGGLSRFDGLSFEVFDLKRYPSLRGNRITALCETDDGALWIGTQSHGLIRRTSGEFEAIAPGPEAAHLGQHIQVLFEDSTGRLWVGTNRGLGWIEDGRIRAHAQLSLSIRALAESPAGTLWIADQEGIRLWDGTLRTLSDEPKVHSLLTATDGTLWMGTSYQGHWQWIDEQPIQRSGSSKWGALAIAEDQAGDIWLGTQPSPSRWNGEHLERPLVALDLVLNESRTILADREGNIWFGGRFGLKRIRPSPLSMVPLPQLEPALNPVRAVAASPNGALWASLYGGELLQYHEGEFLFLDKSSGVAGSSLVVEADGSILFTSLAQLWRLPSGSSPPTPALEGPLPPMPDQAPTKSVSALLRTTNGALWIGRDSLLQRIHSGTPRSWTPAEGLPTGRISALLEARDGALWIGSTTGLAHLDTEGRIRSWLAEDGFAPGTVRALFEDAQQQLWVGSYGGGLARISPDGDVALLDRSHGLAENIVSRIVAVDGDRLLLQGNHTLSIVSLAALNAIASGSRAQVRPRVFSSAPGFASFETNGGYMPLSAQAPDGSFWFPAKEGLLQFDPSIDDQVTVAPGVRIQQVAIGGQPQPLEERIVVPPGPRNLGVQFTAITMVEPEKTRFQHLLEGYDTGWVDRGTGREASYTKVPAGRYRFRVRATNRDGVQSDAEAVVELVFQPFFHETLWFRALVSLLGLTLLVGVFRVRTTQIRRRAATLEVQVAERTRSLQLEVAQRRRVEDELRKAHDHLEDMVQTRTRALLDNLARRAQLERRLAEAEKLEAIGRLTAGIAHDFNNLLTAILGFADLTLFELQDDASTKEEIETNLQEIRTAGVRAADLTTQLLAYSGQQVLQPRTIDPTDAIAGLHGMLRRLVRAEIELKLDLAPGEGYIRVDPGQLEQVILNLVVNASHAIEGKGLITLSTRAVRWSPSSVDPTPTDPSPPSEHILITVADTGAGMDEHTINRAFDPFFTTKAPGKGTGLGLASVHGIVKQSGGHIRLSSEPGAGTHFMVYLPKLGAPGRATEPDTASLPPPVRKATILLCDDEPAIRRVVQLSLKSAGHTLLVASHPAAAIELARTHPEPIDLLITDVVMPDMNGRELADQLLGSGQVAAVLFASGYSADLIAPQGLLASGVAFLAKPFTRTVLLASVNEILARLDT